MVLISDINRVGIINGQFSSSFQTVSCPAYKDIPQCHAPLSPVAAMRPAQWLPMVVTWLEFYATLYLSLLPVTEA